MAYQKYGQAMTVACPYCKVGPSQPCRSPSGSYLDVPHAARKTLADSAHPQAAPIGAETAAALAGDTTAPDPLARKMVDRAMKLRSEASVLVDKAEALEAVSEMLNPA